MQRTAYESNPPLPTVHTTHLEYSFCTDLDFSNIAKLPRLESLIIYHCKDIKNLGSIISASPNLTTLKIIACELTTIPKEVSSLFSLKILDLSENIDLVIRDEIDCFDTLIEVKLDGVKNVNIVGAEILSFEPLPESGECLGYNIGTSLGTVEIQMDKYEKCCEFIKAITNFKYGHLGKRIRSFDINYNSNELESDFDCGYEDSLTLRMELDNETLECTVENKHNGYYSHWAKIIINDSIVHRCIL
jgi:hypothetical protein